MVEILSYQKHANKLLHVDHKQVDSQARLSPDLDFS